MSTLSGRAWLALVIIGACAGVVPRARAQPSTAPCRVAGLPEQVRCTTVVVPENRATGGGRTIPLRVVILPSRATESAPRHALFYLVGGPGLSATNLADLVVDVHATTRATHDIVLIDQRGTGGSNALGCAAAPSAGQGTSGDVATYLADQFPADSARTCAQRLARRADLAQYTTANAAQDLEDVRARLDLDRIDIDASAYGTRVALEYLRRHPDRVRSVVLQGVVPENVSLPLTAARDAQRALDRLFADCASDPFCRTSFPALRRELATLLDRLDKAPLSVRVQHPRTTDSLTVSLTRGVFADRLRVMLYTARLSRRVPIVIHRAYEGDWTPYTTLAYELSRAMLDLLDTGAHLSAACAEDMTGDIDARATFLGDYRAQMYRQACADWPHSIASRSMPVTTQAPVLLVTGALDPVTPPRFAEAVARNMPNATLMIVPGMAHAGAGRCVEEVIAEFVVSGSMQGVDASCVAGIKPPPFITR